MDDTDWWTTGRKRYASELERHACLNAHLPKLGLPEDAEVIFVSLSNRIWEDWGEDSHSVTHTLTCEIQYLRDGKMVEEGDYNARPYTLTREDQEALDLECMVKELLLDAVLKVDAAPPASLPKIPTAKFRFISGPPRFIRAPEVAEGWLVLGRAVDLPPGGDASVHRYGTGEISHVRVETWVAQRWVAHQKGSKHGEGSTQFVLATFNPLLKEPEVAPAAPEPLACGCHCGGGCVDPYAPCGHPCDEHMCF